MIEGFMSRRIRPFAEVAGFFGGREWALITAERA
jgi:hypothetical protein